MRVSWLRFFLLLGLLAGPALADPVELRTRHGRVLVGELVDTTETEVVLHTELGELRSSLANLDAASRAKLAALTRETLATLQRRVAELEGEIAILQAENSRLRATLTTRARPVAAAADGAVAAPVPEGSYWISSSGKRHRSGCRYHGLGKGRASEVREGVACKVCGG
jgi:uncharacterized small protein (DUF1192 family)